jgi:hypothetical protein
MVFFLFLGGLEWGGVVGAAGSFVLLLRNVYVVLEFGGEVGAVGVAGVVGVEQVWVDDFFAFDWVLLVERVHSVGLGQELVLRRRGFVELVEDVLLVVEELVLIHSATLAL